MTRTLTTLDRNLDTEQTIKASSLLAAWRTLAGQLRVDGARTLTAAESWNNGNPEGAWVQASLYPEQDKIVGADGRDLSWMLLTK